jgi:hypothetical protein
MPTPPEVPSHEDRSTREELRAPATPLLHDPKLPRLLRAANVLILITAIVYFLSFLGFMRGRHISWIDIAWNFLTQLLIITPQITPLLVLLIIEARTVGTLKRHVLIFALAVALIGLGQFWTTQVIGAMNYR